MSFDWTTFIFQLVNFVVLLAILRKFLFRPVSDVIARRKAEIEDAMGSAENARSNAVAATAKAEAEAAANAAARHEVLESAKAEAEKQREKILEQARAEATRIVADGQAARKRNSDADEARAQDRARELAASIAERALVSQPRGLEGYAERLSQALQAMAPAERQSLLGAENLRLVAAVSLSEAEREHVGAELGPFGIAPDIETDAGLIAGLELRSDAGAIRNSLAHDLDRILEAMRDDRAA